MPYNIYWSSYLIIINFIAVCATIIDKHNAKKRRRRIPENTLLLLAGLGGSVGMLLTMYAIRHKTQHRKFMYGIPFIIMLQILAAYFLFIRS